MRNQLADLMKKQSLTREYNFSDAELYVVAMQCHGYALRDISEFGRYGYDLARMAEFKSTCERFRDLPSDDELVGEQMIFTEKKNEARERLKTAIRSVMLRVAQKHDPKSGKYRKFGTAKMVDMSDPQLLLCGRRVVRVCEQQLPFLEETGLKMMLVDEVRQNCVAFENAIHLQQDKIADRDISVESRVEAGNKIYREFVTLCDIGKDIWHEKNVAKYENYTIYESNNDQKKARKAKNNESNQQK